ncbi:dimethyl sulfoxide reductase anchor subunit family protein [Cochlodiniinecator piscidefendens]|uniref:dimethyl sulfoxide reductase anchor subunit family protein n=1 Tax=Cochlodiniinecator piscidefendens TaxID=2715756 RepID=UPI00140A0C11|nr:DmsC/YnfH family molybdoenzyme membrane anchor subunit [Cochlodiniinecator piscidefendens]
MHPAPSVIVFTVFSGLGFGLLAFLGLGIPNVGPWASFAFFFIAFACAVGGLLASTFHLGHPERAIKAFSQWRSSWLSREGCLAVAALLVMGLYAFLVIFFDTRIGLLGYIGAALSIATIYATSMIYAQLKTVPRWNTALTPVYFLVLSIGGGALLAGQVHLAGLMLALAGAVQVITWMKGDTRFEERGHTLETATGLGFMGKVRLFEGPHTSANYLMKEMVHVVGRKHSQKLRVIALVFMSLVPSIILLALPAGHFLALVAVVSHIAGTIASRWLFFAEAEHAVGLYYDKR